MHDSTIRDAVNSTSDRAAHSTGCQDETGCQSETILTPNGDDTSANAGHLVTPPPVQIRFAGSRRPIASSGSLIRPSIPLASEPSQSGCVPPVETRDTNPLPRSQVGRTPAAVMTTPTAASPAASAEDSVSGAVGRDHASSVKPTRESRSAGWDGLTRLVWLMAMLAFMVGVRYAVPRFAEDIQYSITRGRERAQYEQAGAELGQTPLAGLSRAYQLVSKRVSPSVVHINVASIATNVSGDGLGFLFSGPGRRESAGQGSGVIVDQSGYIVTNYHVVKGATEIEVGLSDGRRVGAKIVGMDAPTDLAVLRIDADNLVPTVWGDSERLEVGSLVWAAGSPFGLQRTITCGILSAKNRSGLAGTTYHDFLQTDAAVNPGNSGGPLVDEEGRLIGINTAIVGEVYQGISFAIPSNVVREVYDRLRSEGRIARGWLGVEMAEVTEELADQLGLLVPRGVYVVQLVDSLGSSPARLAGVQEGDVIVRWNEDEIISPTTLQRLVGKTQVGSEARVIIVRSGSQLELNVAVGERPVGR